MGRGRPIWDVEAVVSSTYGARPDLVSKLVAPFYISHRGGLLRFPEHSIEGYRASAAARFVPEQDVQLLADGTPVCLHDGTVDRTTNGTGNVSSLTRAQWLALRTDPAILGGKQAIPLLWEDVIQEFGGKQLLMPEIKVSSARDAVLNSITSRSLQRAVIVQGFNYADVQAAATLGISALYLSDTATPATLVADHVEFIGCSTAVSSGYVSAAQAVGLKVIIYTPDTVADIAAQFAKGCDGVFTDDAWFFSGNFVGADSDPFRELVRWPGYQSVDGVNAIHLQPPNELALNNGAANDTNALQSWTGPRSTATGTLKVRAKVRFGVYASDSARWSSIWIGALPAGLTYSDGVAVVGQHGYHCLFRRDGQTQIYSVPDNAGATQIATVTGPVVAAVGVEGTQVVEVEINPTSVILRNLTTAATVTVANTAFRGPVSIVFGSNKTDTYFSDASVINS